ncbi:ATP-dependent DNA/RNA helicase [Elasticomyces elasticus]|nr:ATP-dependent DNA/RNA helicase [Elasticomyces elasticus]
MKRKLNAHDVPEETPAASVPKPISIFSGLGLDSRLLKAIAKEKFSKPTPIQAQAIPLALIGKDILARAQTGSGKTAAYLLPILHSILQRKALQNSSNRTTALILLPTKELASQVTKSIITFTSFCGQEIRAINITRKEDDEVQRAKLLEKPDIVVATPGRASSQMNASALSISDLTHLVIDEADLVLSYGYEDDLTNISTSLPKSVQTMLVSATLRTDLDTLKGLFCQSSSPVMLSFDSEESTTQSVLSQYVVKCAEDEKFLLIYAIFMLKLVKGKVIVFVQDIDRCYRVKLFLEQFGIRSCVLNSELPVNSRIHVVEEFNKGMYDIIIASDEHEVMGEENRSRKKRKVEDDDEEEIKAPANQSEPLQGRTDGDNDVSTSQSLVTAPDHISIQPTSNGHKKNPKRDDEYGISRGIDFQNVSCVLNFDLATSSKSYAHRIGRTARAGKSGIALSFVVPKHLHRKHKPTSIASTEHDEAVLAKIIARQEAQGRKIEPYAFDMKKLDGFRYRLSDALRAVTRIAVREARTRELRNELLKSEKLKQHFEENPQELQLLRHDGESRAVRVQPHLRHVPEYLLPGGKRSVQMDVGFVGRKESRDTEKRVGKARSQGRFGGRKKSAGRKTDPLKSFKGRK